MAINTSVVFERTLNLGFHVTILFSFLMILFIVLISKVEKTAITNEVEDIIDDQVPKMLDELVETEKSTGKIINWNAVDDVAKQLVDDSQGTVPAIDKHNVDVIRTGMYIIVLLLFVIVAVYILATTCLGLKLRIFPIMGENLVLFMFIGVLEALFFLKVASKYVPVMPDYAASVGIDETKSELIDMIQAKTPPV